MMSTSLNVSGKIDPGTVSIFGTVDAALKDLDLPYAIVGATARDLVLHYGHGAAIQRATHDVDFAIEVGDWAAFAALRERLCAQGFRLTEDQHRLIGPRDTVVDIVPFGGVEDAQAAIGLGIAGALSYIHGWSCVGKRVAATIRTEAANRETSA